MNTGEPVSGMIETSSDKAVVDFLKKKYVLPLKIEEVKEEFSLDEWRKARKKVEKEELIIFCRQMYTLLNAGVSITQSLKGLADATESYKLSKILNETILILEEGNELSKSFEKHPDVFNELFVNLVRVGETSGNLPDVFLRLSSYIEFDSETKKQIKSATRYPTIVVCALVVALIIMMVFVIPSFTNMFSSLGAELPLATRILIGTSDFFVNYWYILGTIVGGLAGSFVYYTNQPEGKYKWDKVKLKFPIFGSIIEKSALSRFARSFSMAFRSGLPMLETLLIVSKSVDNAYVCHGILKMRTLIEGGDSFTVAANKAELFTPLVLQMISVGEQTGELDRLLDEVGAMYEREVDYNVKRLGDSIEPILISIMAVMVAVLALGIFLPMWEMGSAMGG